MDVATSRRRSFAHASLRAAASVAINGEKGYGFITPDAGGPDVFVHASALEQAGMRSLMEGQKLEYEVVADRRTGKSSAGSLQTV